MRQNWLEWLAIGVSVLAIGLLAAFLAVDGLTSGGDPPRPVVDLKVDEARESEHGWIVPATIRNEGDQAAERVHVQAIATIAGRDERREAEIDFLPAGTEVELEFVFPGPPDGEVRTAVISYLTP